MRGKAKQRVSLILVVTMVLGTVLTGNTVFATGESSDEQDRIKINISKDSEQTVEQNVTQTIHVTAQGQCSQSVCLNVYLKNEDGSAATDIDAVNLLTSDQLTDKNTQKTIDETLKDSVTLNNGTKASPTAEWKNDKDDNGTVTSKYLQITMPAEAMAINFDMQLQYRTDEASYTKKVLVEAKAFEEEQDITEAAKRADESKENEVTVAWEGQAVSQSESEAADENADGENESQVMAASVETPVTIYFAAPKDWTEKGYTIKMNGEVQADNNTWKTEVMQDTGKTYGDCKVYVAETTTPQGRYYVLQFQAYKNDEWKEQFVAINNVWTDTCNIDKKIYVNGEWKDDFSPFDPNDHTYFAGKSILFYNKTTEDLSAGVTAVFYEKDSSGTLTEVERINMTAGTGNKKFSVTIPDKKCSYIRFVKTLDGKTLGDAYSNFYRQGNGEKDVTESFVYSDSMYCYNYSGSAENSFWGTAGAVTVYYDATLSKLSYENTNGARNDGKGIPYPKTTDVYYYATNGTAKKYGKMTATDNANYPDVYKVELPDGYNQVRFAAYEVKDTKASENGNATDLVTIPGGLMNPCYYGDSSDDVIYKDENRGGYWDEVYTVRDPEKEAEQHNSKAVVDINEGKFTRNASTLYVNSTFYDYYTDYELNGKNRDNYDDYQEPSQRTYVTFRQFDQALSDYYYKANVGIPIYTGHFQPDYSNWGNRFSAIAYTLELYGYDKDNQNGFMSTNNSTLNAKGDGNDKYYDAAAQGLVANALNGNNLMTSDNKVFEPHFNEEFLTGDNSKHTALAKIYKNVSFPFTKQKLNDAGEKDDNGVEYWYFDSADTTLAMRKDIASQNYYLENVGENGQNWSKNVNSASAEQNAYGFFPFNETSTPCKASRYNYGFGTKLEFKFRLTDNGTVVGTDGEEHPIKFNFSGDDDVWVYVDGKLALDVGGAHGKVTGQIDFSGDKKQKSAIVSKTKVSQGSDREGKDVKTTFDLNGSNSDEHTLTMFYMERGMWESNMKVSFNFPQENKLTVEKEVDTTGANDIFKDALANVGTFDFEIKNLATSGDPKKVSDPSNPEVKKVFNDYSDNTTISGTRVYDSKVEVEKDPTESGKENIISYYYPGKKNATDPQSKTDERLVKIQAKDGITFDALDSKGYKYLQFDVYNMDANASGTDPFVALVDDDGTRIGEWASFLTYNGRNNNIDKQTWKTIRIDLEKLKEKILDAGDKRGFDFSKVKEIQFAYWNDVTIYLDKFSFVKPASGEKTGFTTEQKDIPDYGSINSKKLEPVNGSYYQNTKGDTIIYSDGLLSIGNKESAVFSDQFRRGSYLSIAEKNVSPDVFTTTWSLYENGAIVNPNYLTPTNSTTVAGGGQTSVEKQSGYEVNDGRTETSKIELKPTESTIVFRSYANPDSKNAVIDLKAKYVNKLRTGSISLKKELSTGEEETQTERKYKFIIEYRNVAGMKLEANTGADVIKQTIELEAGQETIISGVPAGTDYTIYEEIPEKADYSLEKVKVTDYGNDKNVKAENNVVTGTVVADDVNSTDTAVTFVNTVTPLISISGTKTWEGGVTADTPKNIVVQIQRLNPTTNEYEQAKDKSEKLIPNQVVNIGTNWKYTFTGLLKYVNYTATPKQEYQYRVVELGTLAGYYPEYTKAKDGSYNITNKKTGTLKIIKKAGKTEPLAGAKFTLYKDAKATQVATDCTGKELTGNTGDNGELIFENIMAGTEDTPIKYYLKEVKTKAGYVLLKEPIEIKLPYKYNAGDIVNGNKVTENGVTWNLTYTIINDKAFDLPASGNKGIFKFIVIGITAVLVGGYLLTARKKSRKKKVSRRG